jgi:hypothetical protein
MPLPPTEPIPPPVDESDSARVYLEGHGLVALQPPIRSSDYSLCLSDPFRYYLTRRLGLSPFLSYSTALNRGTWFHTAAQASQTSDPSSFLMNALDARLTELKAVCESVGVLPSAALSFAQRERRDFETSSAWFDAARSVPFHQGKSLDTFFAPFTTISSELTLRHPLTINGVTMQAVCTVDRFLLRDNHLYILDYKTCSEPPTIRLAKCPLEMQTWLYSLITSEMLEAGTLQRHLDLPPSVTFGGMYHVAIQKPTIKMGLNDRPYRDVPFTPSSGKNKGITRIEREYYGEPSFANYVARCTSWYTRSGEFSASPFEEPPINISFISPSLLKSPLTMKALHTRLLLIHSFATRPANPDNFPMNPDGIYNFRGQTLSPFAPLYQRPVIEWPSLIAEARFVVDHRDDPADTPPSE